MGSDLKESLGIINRPTTSLLLLVPLKKASCPPFFNQSLCVHYPECVSCSKLIVFRCLVSVSFQYLFIAVPWVGSWCVIGTFFCQSNSLALPHFFNSLEPNRNCLGQFREIPWTQTTDAHQGSTLIKRMIT